MPLVLGTSWVQRIARTHWKQQHRPLFIVQSQSLRWLKLFRCNFARETRFDAHIEGLKNTWLVLLRMEVTAVEGQLAQL